MEISSTQKPQKYLNALNVTLNLAIRKIIKDI